MIEIRNMLCPIDFSEYSRRALDHALAMARWYDSSITVLHVYSATPAAVYAPGFQVLESTALTPVMSESPLAYSHLNRETFRKACEDNSRERLNAAVPDPNSARTSS